MSSTARTASTTYAAFTTGQKVAVHALMLAFIAVAALMGMAVGGSLGNTTPASATTVSPAPAAPATQTGFSFGNSTGSVGNAR